MPEHQTRVYHWVLTLQWQTRPGSTAIASADGTYSARPGQTAHDIYREVRAWAIAQHQAPTDAHVLHWTLTPNHL